MKILITGDWHIRKNAPENRTDDYWETVLYKLKFILKTATDYDAEIIIQPGDLFDTVQTSYLVYSEVSRLLNTYSGLFLSVEGQHDIWYHNLENKNNPHHALCSSEIIQRPGQYGIFLKDIGIYGAGFGEPVPATRNMDYFNILVMHRMVIKEKIWKKQTDFNRCGDLLKNHAFDLIVSGDNHQSFYSHIGNKFLFNCGSLLRTTTAQKNHKPVIYIFDTETKEFEKIYIPIKPFSEIMNVGELERKEKDNKEIVAFIESLPEYFKIKRISKDQYVKLVLEKAGKDKEIISIIQNIFERAE